MPVIIQGVKKGKKMDVFLYIIIFIIGTLFGSFYTLAVYRIPQNIDIIKKHSYCPNCNHKLGFFELIPILSYIFLGGKCKNCKQKIRIRYLLLEILSGIISIVIAIALRINTQNISIQLLELFIIVELYITILILISGIDKEYININKSVLSCGIIISILYMIYLYTIGETSIYRYAIYLATYAILLSIDTILLRNYGKSSYIINLLLYLNIIFIFTGIEIFISTIIMATIAILIYALIRKINQKKTGNKKIKISDIPFGFYIGTSNIIIIFIKTAITYYFVF